MDKKAKKILFTSYWGSSGWKSEKERIPSEEDFRYAKSHKVMFDPVVIRHDDLIEEAVELRGKVSVVSVANAFVWSLESRELDYRSALGSFSILYHFPVHSLDRNALRCDICGEYNNKSETQTDLNVLNFERIKWGGVRHLQPVYSVFDIRQFLDLPDREPSKNAIDILKRILDCIRSAEPSVTSAKLHTYLSKCFKSNKAEREVVISIFGYCGILQTREHQGFQNAFIHSTDRSEPSRRFVDMDYPACWWMGSDGVEQTSVDKWFGHLI